MGNTTRRRRRIREIKPEELDFETTDTASQFDFDASDRRRFQRAAMEVPVRIRLIGKDGRELCRGKAMLRDLSLDGAFLAGIQIEQTADGRTVADFTDCKHIEFVILDGPFKGAEAAATPVRAGLANGGVGVRLNSGFSFTV